jgi:GT2 family glycosyltransferase
MASVTAVIVNWNRRDLLERLLTRLTGQTHPVCEVVVVDNGSEDGSAELAEGRGGRVLRMGWNAGFSRAVNRGVRESRTEWVAVINNDVEPAQDWLEKLVETARNSDAWFASGKIYRAGCADLLDGGFDALSRGGCAWRCGQGRNDGPVWSEPRPIWFVPFTAALFRRELFERVGFLDEDFESYLEDVEFGLRCALAGYRGLYVPNAIAYHEGSATLGPWHKEVVRRLARNQVLLVSKHYPERWLLRFGWPVLAGQMLWGLVALRHGAGVAYLRGKVEGLWLFRRLRKPSGSADRLAAVLEVSEGDLRSLQQQSGFDWYWRLYFALT